MNTVNLAEGAYDSLFGGSRNLSTAERVGSVILGLAAFATAPKRRPLLGALLASAGLALIGRGMSGHCPAKAALAGDQPRRADRALEQRPARREERQLSAVEAAP